MHRPDLHGALLGACRAQPGVTLETSKAALGVEDLVTRARVRCADGSVYGHPQPFPAKDNDGARAHRIPR
jgi:hypothetical protein